MGVTSERNAVPQREEVEAWMPTGNNFKDELLQNVKLNCLAAPWLPSPTRQSAKLKNLLKHHTKAESDQTRTATLNVHLKPETFKNNTTFYYI
ncbi:MAG: hypothetical protein CMK64_11975 [Pseudoalteromonas sp.]|nr:hypothetical protein [Pseudoalteromonas sp.]